MSGPFVLAAGGTGGHLFPAQALASELIKRGSRVIVMTDGRGHNYRSAFPGAEITTVPAATFAGRSPIGRLVAFGVIAMGVVAALAKLKSLRPRAVVGIRAGSRHGCTTAESRLHRSPRTATPAARRTAHRRCRPSTRRHR